MVTVDLEGTNLINPAFFDHESSSRGIGSISVPHLPSTFTLLRLLHLLNCFIFSLCIMPGGSRSRDGCFNCRKRKRRCDEEKPVCRRCRKIGDDCVFPTSTLKFVVAASDHYMIPIQQNLSFLNLSTRELVAICDYQGVWVQRSLPRTLLPFPEATGMENALVQYCMFLSN
jgi:hypothetical protein